MKFLLLMAALTFSTVALEGCAHPVGRPIVACPIGSHPGPYGHRCFLN